MRNRIILTILFLITTITLSSCEDSGITPGKITVNGQVGHDIGYSSNVRIEIGDQNTITDAGGRFSVQNVTTPYDIKILHQQNNFVNIYRGVSVSNPYFNLSPSLTGNSNLARIIPQLPIPLNSNQKVFFYFKSNNDIVQYQDLTPHPALILLWNESVNQLTGKFILMYCTVISGKIVSYDKYYEQDGVSLTNQQDLNLQITEAQLNFDPGEKIISGNIVNPYGGSVQIGLLLNYSDKRPLGLPSGLVGSNASGSYSFTIPDNVPTPFNPMIFLTQYNPNGDISALFKHREGGNNSLKLHSSPLPISPVNGDSIALFNTEFQWSSGDAEGVFCLILISRTTPYKFLKVFLNSNTTKIPDLTNLGFNYLELGNNYDWTVFKFFTFEGIDEFVSANPSLNENYIGSIGETVPIQIRVY